MKLINLRDRVNRGYHPVVRFKKQIEDMETYFDENMVARIVNVSHAHDDVFSFVFDVSAYNDYNAVYETANYYDKEGNACLTATEADMHPSKNHMKEDVCFMTTGRVEEWFEIVSDEGTGLFERYEAEASGSDTYVQWLEAQAARLEARVKRLQGEVDALIEM